MKAVYWLLAILGFASLCFAAYPVLNFPIIKFDSGYMVDEIIAKHINVDTLDSKQSKILEQYRGGIHGNHKALSSYASNLLIVAATGWGLLAIVLWVNAYMIRRHCQRIRLTSSDS